MNPFLRDAVGDRRWRLTRPATKDSLPRMIHGDVAAFANAGLREMDANFATPPYSGECGYDSASPTSCVDE